MALVRPPDTPPAYIEWKTEECCLLTLFSVFKRVLLEWQKWIVSWFEKEPQITHTVTPLPPQASPVLPPQVQSDLPQTEPVSPPAQPAPPQVKPSLISRELFDAALNAERNVFLSSCIDLTGNDEKALPICEAIYTKTLPRIGRYGSPYKQANEILTLKLPLGHLSKFPLSIQHKIAESDYDLFFILLDGREVREESRNAIFHAWCFPELEYRGSRSKNFAMGLFEPRGVSPAENGSIGIDTFNVQQVHIHDYCISPNNARFNVTEDISSFYLACQGEGRGVAAYCVLLNEEEIAKQVSDTGLPRNSCSVNDFLEKVPLPQEIRNKMGELLTYAP